MSDIIQVIADSYQTLQHLSQLLAESEATGAEILLADLHLQLARIEAEGARLWQENIELHRYALSQSMASTTKSSPHHASSRSLNVRQTMQKVSEFYQLYTRPRQAIAAA
jgi:hypothetical protein